ncbi:pancreatic lipase-related protein 2 isoform X2 [Folsomia candida]|uniref:pancreatic lipase-related protein 2 isoform X2 n=1 Tax=Folsomia candida TaxID=158441 RepID=UPI000B901F44|nr:pancreatic lipase-related protein 2 isoform X2 [Folsomia candida]
MTFNQPRLHFQSKCTVFRCMVCLAFTSLCWYCHGADAFQIPEFVGKTYKAITTGVATVGSAVPDPQDALTFVPRVLIDTKHNIDKKLLSQDSEDVRFLLYEDKQNPESFTEIKVGDPESLFETTLFDHKKPVKFLVHGFQQNWESRFPQILKEAYLEHTDYNVFVVDWGGLARPRAGQLASVLYPLVVENVPRVGEKVADFIVYLRSNDFISNLNLVHLIGFSLGAHVSAIAGNSVKRRMGGYKVGRITGLDPAGPKFLTAHRERRLDVGDATFVDVIHTSQLGYMTQIGHADFFPNGGLKQPNCVDPDFNLVQTISSLGTAIAGSCSHTRAAEYFNRSITEDIYACKCNSWVDYKVSCQNSCQTIVKFGDPCPHGARGSFYFDIMPQ